jgi:hypothetical protein
MVKTVFYVSRGVKTMLEKILLELPVLSGVIFAVVAWLKQMGVEGKWLTGSAFAVGLVIGMAYRYAVVPMTDFPSWFFAILFGLAGGALATGAYKGAEGLAEKAAKEK